MYKRSFWLLFIAFFFFSSNGTAVAQKRTTFEFENWKFETHVYTLEKFLPWNTSLIVEESAAIDIPTIFSLDTPASARFRVNSVFEQEKSEWKTKFPDSKVIEIHHYPTLSNMGMNHGRSAFVWVISGDKILNIELVRNGACTAANMLLNKNQERYILIPRGLYDEIKERLLKAEEFAKSEGRGIWVKQS